MRSAPPSPELPPNSLPIYHDGKTFVNMDNYANTRIRRAMLPEAAQWCFDHIGPWVIDPEGRHITFKHECDVLVFKMWWAGRK